MMKLSWHAIALIVHLGIRLGVAVLVVFSSVYGFYGSSTFIVRPFGSESIHAITAWADYMQEYDQSPGNGTVRARLDYGQSFDSDHIARYMLGSSNVRFSGSRVRDRCDQDILADYFGLPSDFQSNVTVQPCIQTILGDVAGYKTLYQKTVGDSKKSVYVSCHIPFVHTRWDMRLRETVLEEGVNFHPAGYLGGGNRRINRADLVDRVETALHGGVTFGDMLQPLRFGKINGSRHATGISAFNIALGLTLDGPEDRLGGVFIQLGLPTGARRSAEFLFEPYVGNGRHVELGMGAQGRVTLWRDCSHDYALIARVYCSHLYAAKQKRSFDLVRNGKGSRYMLLQKMGSIRTDVQIPAGVLVSTQYQGLLLPALHVTTLDTDIKVAIQGDVTLALRAGHCNWDIDLGYSWWGRSREKIEARQKIPNFSYAVKGDASIYGFTVASSAVELNATQHEATLHVGQGVGNATFTNLNVDHAAAADGLASLTVSDAADLGIAAGIAHGSHPPELLTDTDIDELSALASSAHTHTLFMQGSYHFDFASQRDVYMGFGARIEMAGGSVNTRPVASQWGIWLLAGLSY